MNQDVMQRRTWSTRKPLRVGLVAVVFFVGVIGVWGVQTSISGAILAPGRIQVSSIRTALQHPIGGTVAELLVEDGDKVQAGDVVLRLDDSQIRSELKVVESELFETLADSARLKAIIDDNSDLILDPLLEAQLLSDPKIVTLLDRQRRQLLAYYESVDTNRRSLTNQIKEVENQLEGAEAELESKFEKLEFVGTELVRLSDAHDRGLVSMTEVQNLRKEQIDTEGEIGKLNAGIAALKGTKLELELKIHGLLPALKEQADEKLNQLQRENGKFSESRIGILDELSKLEIRTPISGRIHDSKIQGLRSVVIAGTPLMYVVPDDRPITVSARISSGDIDQVTLGQSAILKFVAFDRRSLPNIYGQVSKVSPDSFLDPKTQKYFYTIEVFLAADEIEKLGDNVLISGMPVSVYITTNSRSPFEYVTRPISRYLDRAFRDS